MKIERSGPYVVRDSIRTKMDEMAGAAYAGMCRSLAVSSVSGLVEIFELCTITYFGACARGFYGMGSKGSGCGAAANICEIQIPDGEYISTIRYVKMEKEFIRESTDYE